MLLDESASRPSPAVRQLRDESTVDVAVVGAGPAGVAAAAATAGLGLSVALLDEQPQLGGQYLSGHPAQKSSRAGATWAERTGCGMLAALPKQHLDIWTETLVWNIRPGFELNLFRAGRVARLHAGAVILACGARELSVPFPGWTLPGVTTVGAAQLLAKRFDLATGKRVLLAGSGPLLLAAASELLRLGVRPVAILEAAGPRKGLRHAPAAWGHWDRLAEGFGHLRRIMQAGVAYRLEHAVVAAHGQGRVESVGIAALDGAGKPRPGSVEHLDVDALCVSFGLAPNVELAQLAGAALSFDPTLGGWAPRVDEHLQTTVEGMFVAGETAAVAGAASALLTGRIAGLAAAVHLGRLPGQSLERELEATGTQRRREARFGRMYNTLFAPPPGLWSMTTDETVVCRCEEVTAGEVRAAAARGVHSLDALKTWNRVGHGRCQGRTCGPIVAQLIARESGRPVDQTGFFNVRPPVKPVPLQALARPALQPAETGGAPT